ncbi:hypothetical protein M5K25_023281 [Dendrobium thyrsiflorum]|uniref:Uncharacterized protein n=1 Tax=Dendrobium thyrsiflorum TaxID=117978 RepID=A0ABD0UEP2_DENTH
MEGRSLPRKWGISFLISTNENMPRLQKSIGQFNTWPCAPDSLRPFYKSQSLAPFSFKTFIASLSRGFAALHNFQGAAPGSHPTTLRKACIGGLPVRRERRKRDFR